MMDKKDNNIKECSECKSTFIRQSDMIRHIKRFHSSKAEKLINELDSKIHPFKCDQCEKGFFHKKNLNFHQKSHTSIISSGVIFQKKCPLCNHVATFKKDFYDHCREIHNILLDVEKIDFASLDDFLNWKCEIEKAVDSKFVKEYGSTAKMTNYICSHSKYSILENGVETESTVSNKVDGFCPAGFRVMHEDSGKCSIYFVKTHICHQNKNLYFESNTGKATISSAVNKIEAQKLQNNKEVKFESSEINYTNQVDDVGLSHSPNLKSKSGMNSKKKNFLNKKKEMIKNVLSTLNTISSITELEAVQELVNPIKPILGILRRKSEEFSPKKRLKSSKVTSKK
ncbi:hypothetical protein WA026_017408 [Henosepilachna vigintioctopunctata]|uniref:C2H2-type domain-containing protein n=1 Tax=Henosepilachna vigintioctopunctata TaxID=420089 RepID=A0AAW1VEX4_9CUCU